ncbi:MAG: signal recognition particle-docking protein FtsY [Eubacteriales bacterium]|nr:signal recognition particle-docking protein FtsY [Eubacteriales bacterium]
MGENGFWAKLYKGLTKTRESLADKLSSLFGGAGELDDDFFEELEMILISADIGAVTTERIIEALRDEIKKEKMKTADEAREALVRIITEMMSTSEPYEPKKPTVILIVGVNGVGKTTVIGKLGNLYKSEGLSVMFAAGDTFRAAAVEQLGIWAERVGAPCVKHQEGSDSAAVIFDAVRSAKAKKTDVLICDTAGRLHNKHNLMEELRKINSVIEKEYPEADRQVWLALDATTGQNAVAQAKAFAAVSGINGIVLNKMDGTAKGGIVISICNEMEIPVRYIGVGEGIDDIRPFDATEFCRAMIKTA